MKKLFLLIALVIILPITVNAGNVKPTHSLKLFSWISTHLIYPQDAIANKEEGVVYISFSVDENGKAPNVFVKEGISTALNTAALTVVKDMPLMDLYNAKNPDKLYVLPIQFSIQ